MIRDPKGLACPNLEGRFPTLDATRTQISRSKGQRSRSPGPLKLTHIVRHIFRIARSTSLVYGWRTTHRISHSQGQRSRSQGHVICLSRVGPMAHKSKTNSRSITKIGRKVPQDTCYIAHQFQGQKVKGRVTGRLTQTHKMCHIFRTVRLKNFKIGMWKEDVNPHQRQAPWPPRLKVKVTRSHGMSDSEICTWYSWQSTKTRMTDNRGDPKGQRLRS